eukprot:280775_1
MHRGPHPWYTIPSSKFLSAVMFQTKREYSFLFVCALLVVSSGFHFAHAANDDNVEVDAHAANDENVEVDVSDHYKLIDVALKTSKVIMKKFGKMESEDELRRQSAEFHVKTQKALTETVAELENEYPDLRADLRHTIRKRLKILYSKISLFEKEKYRILEEREMDYNIIGDKCDDLQYHLKAVEGNAIAYQKIVKEKANQLKLNEKAHARKEKLMRTELSNSQSMTAKMKDELLRLEKQFKSNERKLEEEKLIKDRVANTNTELSKENEALKKKADDRAKELEQTRRLNLEEKQKNEELKKQFDEHTKKLQRQKQRNEELERRAAYLERRRMIDIQTTERNTKLYFEYLRKKEPEKMEEEPPKSDVEDLTSSSYTEPDLFGDSIKDNQRETWWKSFYSGIDLANVLSKILGPSLLGCVIAGGTMIAVIFNIVYQGAVGDWFRENASCSAFIAKFSVCGSLVTFLFGAAKLTADPMRAVHKGVKAAISTITGMPMGYKILIGVGLVLTCVLSIVCYFFRWRILRCICGYERRISLNRFAHRPRRRHRNFGSAKMKDEVLRLEKQFKSNERKLEREKLIKAKMKDELLRLEKQFKSNERKLEEGE